MRVLAIDVGTGTQDILLFDSARAIENCVQLVMPAPTAIAARRVRAATRSRQPVVLVGTNAGGGPVTAAVREHLHAGLPAYATAAAAVTFDDDLEVVRRMGVTLMGEEEAAPLGATRVTLGDLDLAMVRRALEAFEVEAAWDALAVAVFDHGNAPPGYSDRRFRFDHLRRRVATGSPSVHAFAYLAAEVPDYLTRMRAVVATAGDGTPLLLMDTAVAAVVGSLEDPHVAARECKVVANVGNEHTLAFHLHGENILGLFEHHTHLLSRQVLEDHLLALPRGTLDGDAIWRSQGHGAIVLQGGEKLGFLSVVGPLRGLLNGSRLAPYFAAPHGNMMLAGCFGLLRGWAERCPPWREEIMAALGAVGDGIAHSY